MSDHEEPDLDVLHRAVLRERQEPYEGREPVPVWMGALFVLLIAWGGWYLGRYDARFDSARSDMQPLYSAQAALVAPATTGGSEPAAAPDAGRGEVLYAGRCAACHQATGTGMAGLAPQLDGSDWVAGDPERLARVVLHGLSGPIEVNGQPFTGSMPPWGPSMSDAEIADVLTFIRSAWSNRADPIDEATVQRVRASTDRSAPWTAAEL